MRKAWKPIEASLVLFLLVDFDPLWADLASPGTVLFALPLVSEDRHAEPARIDDVRQLDDDDTADALDLRELNLQARKFRVLGFDHAALTVQPQNFRRTFEGAEHQNDAIVMSD